MPRNAVLTRMFHVKQLDYTFLTRDFCVSRETIGYVTICRFLSAKVIKFSTPPKIERWIEKCENHPKSSKKVAKRPQNTPKSIILAVK